MMTRSQHRWVTTGTKMDGMSRHSPVPGYQLLFYLRCVLVWKAILDLLGYLVVKGSGVVYFVSRFMATLRKIIVIIDDGVRFAKAEI